MSNLTSPPEGWCYRLRYTTHTNTHRHTYVRSRTTVLSHTYFTKNPTQQCLTPHTIIATSIFISSTQILLPPTHLTLSLTFLYLIKRSFFTQNTYRLRNSSSSNKSSTDPLVSFQIVNSSALLPIRRTA